jgi:hypothetical protein
MGAGAGVGSGAGAGAGGGGAGSGAGLSEQAAIMVMPANGKIWMKVRRVDVFCMGISSVLKTLSVGPLRSIPQTQAKVHGFLYQ